MKQITVLMAVVLSWLLCGCAAATFGKVDLSSGQPPNLLQIGQTTQQDVLAQLGEPLGYREQGDRAAMVYEYAQENFLWLIYGSYWQEKAYLLYLVFQNNVLIKAEVRRYGWGFAGDIDPQLMQVLFR